LDFEKNCRAPLRRRRSANRVFAKRVDLKFGKSARTTDADKEKAPSTKIPNERKQQRVRCFSESDRAGGITRRAVDGRASRDSPGAERREEIPLARREVSEETNALRRVSTA